jgi:hypothetical protein
MMQQVVSYVLTLLAGSGVTAILGLIFLPKLADHLSARALERLKTDLRASAFQHETRFAWFYTQRAKALIDLYRRVADVQTAAAILAERASIGQNQDELQDNLTVAVDELFVHFNRSQIYLEQKIRETLRGFMQRTNDAAALLEGATSRERMDASLWCSHVCLLLGELVRAG